VHQVSRIPISRRLSLLTVVALAASSPGSASASASAPARWVTGPTLHAGSVHALSCPSARLCVALGSRLVRFDPSVRGGTQQIVVKGFKPSDVACPSPRECVVVGHGAPHRDAAGDLRFPVDELSLDPAANATGGAFSVIDAATNDPDDPVLGAKVTCVSVTNCVAIDWRYNVGVRGQAFDPVARTFRPGFTADNTDTGYTGNAPVGLSCPSARRCVVIDNFGGETTFDPASPGSPKRSQLKAAFYGLACPSTRLCLALGPLDNIYTFPPLHPRRIRRHSLKGGQLTALVCTDMRHCLLAGADGSVLSGNPMTPARFRPERIQGAQGIVELACPTSTDCVAIDAAGRSFVRRG